MSEQLENFPSPEEFLLKFPLYRGITIREEGDDWARVRDLIKFTGPLDCYCVDCGLPSVFRSTGSPFNPTGGWVTNWATMCGFICTRNLQHTVSFTFLMKDRVLQKIGQFPSLSDLAEVELREYREILDPSLYREFNRALGLSSYGLGIGAFVYLRRIFESLVEEAHAQTSEDAGWNENEYQRSRMDDRIKLLRGHVPSFLYDHRAVYGVLSAGVHELSEEECLEAFPAIRTGIELMLDEKISRQKQQDKIAEGSGAVRKMLQRMKGGRTGGPD